MQINLHEISQNLFSGNTKKKYFNMSSAEYFTQSARRQKHNCIFKAFLHLNLYFITIYLFVILYSLSHCTKSSNGIWTPEKQNRSVHSFWYYILFKLYYDRVPERSTDT